MQPFSDHHTFGKDNRFVAKCFTSSYELCGHYPIYLIVVDSQQQDHLKLPPIVYQKDLRDIRNLAQVRAALYARYPEAVADSSEALASPHLATRCTLLRQEVKRLLALLEARLAQERFSQDPWQEVADLVNLRDLLADALS